MTPYEKDKEIESQARETRTTLNYLLPSPSTSGTTKIPNRRFVSRGVEVNTGKYGPYAVTIRDGRSVTNPLPAEAHFSLDRHGFCFLSSVPSRVKNFRDEGEIERGDYVGEVAGFVREKLGADFVVGVGWMVRNSGGGVSGGDGGDEGENGENGEEGEKGEEEVKEVGGEEEGKGERRKYEHKSSLNQPAASEVHVDTEPSRQLAYAQRFYAKARPDGPGFKRFVISSFWRCFSPPPQDCPLALCDGRSVRDDEGTPNVLWVVDRIPETEEEMVRPSTEGEEEENKLAASVFEYSAEHRWWYFSGMREDEALLFKFHDSEMGKGGGGGGGAWRVPHSAFWDRESCFGDDDDAEGDGKKKNVRESIECRTVAFWE